MKKLCTLLLAAGLVFGAATGASAIDFKAKGQWIMSFDYGQNTKFTGGNGATGAGDGTDEFNAKQRVRLQLDAVASESLSGTAFFEIGGTTWGKNADGGALGADSNAPIKLKNAYIDWMVPETDLKVRMGLQGMALPSFTTGSNVFNDDVTGITASYQFNDNVGATVFWARPWNDNFDGKGDVHNRANYMDNVDAFGLLVPLSFDGVKVTPWVMYAAIGPNAWRGTNNDNSRNYLNNITGTSAKYPRAGMLPVGGSLHKDGSPVVKTLNRYGDAIWAGLTGEVTLLDPLRIAWDVNYGSVSYADSRMNRAGWLASLLVEYKMDWAIPGIYGWYASGDDDNPANGSERMPSLSVNNNNNGFSNFAYNGNPYIAREAILGYDMSGTWGIGVRLKDMSFLEDLKHTLRINLIGGTNSTTMTRYLGNNPDFNTGINGANANDLGMQPLYMTTNDYAMEFGLTNTYKMYENFTIMLDAAYLATWLDHSKSVWGNSHMKGRTDDQVRDPWNVNLSFVYAF